MAKGFFDRTNDVKAEWGAWQADFERHAGILKFCQDKGWLVRCGNLNEARPYLEALRALWYEMIGLVKEDKIENIRTKFKALSETISTHDEQKSRGLRIPSSFFKDLFEQFDALHTLLMIERQNANLGISVGQRKRAKRGTRLKQALNVIKPKKDGEINNQT